MTKFQEKVGELGLFIPKNLHCIFGGLLANSQTQTGYITFKFVDQINQLIYCLQNTGLPELTWYWRWRYIWWPIGW